MNNINTEIRKRIDNRNKLFWTASAEGGAVIGATSEIVQYFESQSYLNWEGGFEEQIQDLRENQKLLSENMGYIRERGVKFRWDYLKLFANKDVNAPRSTFSSIGDDGNIKIMSSGDIHQLREGITPPGYVGHHINRVIDRPDLAGDPENIKIFTTKGHIPYGHPGGTRIPTSGEAKEITNRIDRIEEHNENIRETEGYIISGLIFGSIGAFIKWKQMSKDPRPWKKKSAIIAGTFALSGIQGAGIAIAAHLTSELIQDSVADFATEYAAEFGTEASSEVFSDLLGAAGGIEAAIFLRLGVKLVSELIKGKSFKGIAPDIGTALAQATAEQIAFFLLGIALDNLTPIPDPHLATIVTALRITYSLGKLGINYNRNKRNAVECARKRMDTLYDIAAISFA